ncbi:MAG: helix-turn-helix domain-containing protein [Cyclobacteriaceae bacterium]|nr:helix-turn-helix domain-containing protein [Cyclobacteriaceae bacterium]
MELEPNKIADLASQYINSTDRHLFLTGKAGTGKTTFLSEIRKNTYKNTVVAAPTGIAAINAGGVTLHSLFHLPFGSFVPANGVQNASINTPQSVLAKLKMNSSKRKLLRELELLIIDEVSMLRADLLDCIDVVLRSIRRKRNLPFGGVQLLLIGDLYQLPPVVKNHEWQFLSSYYASMFFFDSVALKQSPPVYIELEKIYRQSDQKFIDVLNRLRNSKLTTKDAELFNSFYKPNFEPDDAEGYIHVTTHNRKADIVNSDKLAKLTAKPHSFDARIQGDFNENMYPALEKLELKEGAQVMFIKNDSGEEKLFYNGKIGKVLTIGKEELIIQCGEGELIELEPAIWENIRYTLDKNTGEIDEKLIGSFTQYPLRLAWAITVHKSQGLTFDKAILDLSDVFAPGQMYVALSRLRSLDGLVLSSPINQSIFKQDTAITDFGKKKTSFEELKGSIADESKQFLIGYITKAFSFENLVQELIWHKSSFTKGENRSAKQQYLQWTLELIDKTQPLKEVGDKFNRQIAHIIGSGEVEYQKLLNERLQKAIGYFKPILEELSKLVEEHLDLLSERKRIKGYITEVKELAALFSQKKITLQKVQLLVSEMADGRALTKEKLQSLYDSVPKKQKAIKKKKDKTPTKEISFVKYKEGNTVEEIAKERGLVVGTIIGHLSEYIEVGQLDAADFIDSYKLNTIVDVVAKLDSRQPGEIKHKLGDEYSYTDVKIALAHIASME